MTQINKPLHIVCGELDGAACAPEPAHLRLNSGHGEAEGTVLLRIEDLNKRLGTNLPSRYVDLVELATYVYCADRGVKRPLTPRGDHSLGGGWRRNLQFHLPVRDYAFWSRPEVAQALEGVLEYLSGETLRFHFYQAKRPTALQDYIQFGKDDEKRPAPEKVVMFSGGLDSLAGVVESAAKFGERLLLVTHESTPKNTGFARRLGAEIAKRWPQSQPLHITVRASFRKDSSKEHTQRTRSFLFAAFGATIARMVGLNRLCFYENGVISLNLPISAQVIGSRATRTTHPRVLDGFKKLFSLMAESQFEVENPFLDLTKADVVRRIVEHGGQELIASSRSCAHTWEWTHEHTHCGGCSQCIDRRLAMVAAKATAHEPIGHYARDIFLNPRPDDDDKLMLAAYLHRAEVALGIQSANELVGNYPELLDALPYMGGKLSQAAQRVLHLHKRHGQEVMGAVDEIIAGSASLIRQGKVGGGSLVMTVTDSRGSAPAAPPAPAVKKHRVFLDRGADVVFWWNGYDHTVKTSLGLRYILHLLQRPGEEIGHLELANEIKPRFDEEELKSFILSGAARGMPKVTDSGKQRAVSILADYESQLEQAEINGTPTREIEAIEAQITVLKKYLSQGVGKDGKLRKVGGINESARSSVLQAMTRVRNNLEKQTRARELLAEFKRIGPGSEGKLKFRAEEKEAWQEVSEDRPE